MKAEWLVVPYTHTKLYKKEEKKMLTKDEGLKKQHSWFRWEFQSARKIAGALSVGNAQI